MMLDLSRYSLVKFDADENDDDNKDKTNNENNLHLSSVFYVSGIMKNH